MRIGFLVISSVLLFSSFWNESNTVIPLTEKYQQVFIKDLDSTSTPNIIIEGVYLITKDFASEKNYVLAILALKHQLPLAMKTKSRKLFEEILSDKFVMRCEDEFLTKEDYINDKVHGTWTIDTMHYYNLVLQFFGKTALLNYRNILDGTDNNGIPNIEYYSWADMYINESGQWKILSANNVEARNEYKNKLIMKNHK